MLLIMILIKVWVVSLLFVPKDIVIISHLINLMVIMIDMVKGLCLELVMIKV